MTVSAKVGRRLTVGTMLRRAAQLAGVLGSGQQLSAGDKEMARDHLELIIDELATEGVFARDIDFFVQNLVAGTFTYDMPTNYFDVIGDGMYIPAGTADLTKASGETLVVQVTRERWHEISAKDAQSGRTTIFYTNRENDTTQLVFWPIPDENGYVRVQAQRFLSDCDDDNLTIDLQPFWMSFLLWELSMHIAESKSMPNDKIGRLRGKAEDFKKRARGKANQHPSTQMVVHHAVRFSR